VAVAFDAVGPSSAGAASATSPLNWTHTAVGSGVAIVVDVAEGHAAGADGTIAATCDGNSMTLLGSVDNNNSNGGRTLVFGIANRSSGAHSISVTRTGGATLNSLVGGSKSYTGADLTAPFGTAQTAFGATGSPTIGHTGSASGNIVSAAGSVGSGSLATMVAGTKRWSNDFDSTSAAGNAAGADRAGGGGTVTITFQSNADWWGAVAVEVKVPSGAAAADPGPLLPVPPGLANPFAFRHPAAFGTRLPQVPDVPATTPVYMAGGGVVAGAGSSRVYPVAQGTAAGDTLLIGISVNNTTGTVSAVTDSKGNVYTLDGSWESTSPMAYFYRSPGATGGSGGGPTAALTTSDTFTLTTAAISANITALLADVPGVTGMDSNTGIQNGTNVTSAPLTVTPTTNADIAVGMYVTQDAGGQPAVVPPFVFEGQQKTGSNPYNLVTAQVLGAGSSGVPQTSTITFATANYRGVGYAFFTTVVGPTTWSLAGTASNTSAASGTITQQIPIAGTAANISAASGTLALTSPAAGTASNVSAASGTLTLRHALAGTAPTSSSATGSLTLIAAIAGTSPTVSAASGTLTLISPAAGTASSTSSASGALTLTIPTAGTASNTSSAAGAFLPATIAGTASTVSSATGAITSAPTATTWALAGTASNTSSANGALTLVAVLAGTASNASAASGAFLPAAIAGTASNTSAASGALTLIAVIAGTSASVSSATGALTLIAKVAGTASNVSTATGSLTLLAVIAGTATSTSSASGAFLPAPVAGTASNTSVASGALTLRLVLAGAASTVSVATGAFLPASITGTAVTVSSATGAITSAQGPTTWSLAGTAAKVSTASGAFTLLAVIAGSSTSTSTASGSLTLVAKIAGTAANVSVAVGVLAPKVALAGTAANTSIAAGALTSLLVLRGTAVTTSLASGILGVRLALAGIAITVSQATGALTSVPLAVLPDIIGCVITILTYRGTVTIGTFGVALQVSTVECDHIDVENLGITVEVR
jgi:hypothetical protein